MSTSPEHDFDREDGSSGYGEDSGRRFEADERRVRDGGESPIGLLISGALFLYIGFWLGLRGISDDAVYNLSVAAFTWMSRIVGIGLIVLAGMTMVRAPFVRPLNLLFSGMAAVGCLGPGAIWLMHGEIQGIFLCLFGLWNGSATLSIWRSGRRGG